MTYLGHPQRDKIALVIWDMTLIALSMVVGWYVSTGHLRYMAHNAVWILALGPAFVAALYVWDLYSLGALSGLGTLVRAGLAVISASGLCVFIFHVLGAPSPVYQSLETCLWVLPVATYTSRRFYFNNFCKLRSPENILVIGSKTDAKILNSAVSHVHPNYRLIGRLSTGRTLKEATPRSVSSIRTHGNFSLRTYPQPWRQRRRRFKFQKLLGKKKSRFLSSGRQPRKLF